jgi:hypothetical protein
MAVIVQKKELVLLILRSVQLEGLESEGTGFAELAEFAEFAEFAE